MIKLNLKKGWNFVSFPFDEISFLTNNIDITQIKSLSKTWNRNVPNIFNTLTQFNKTDGYIVFANKETIIEFDNKLFPIFEIKYNINKGWNLIGTHFKINIDETLNTNIIEIKDSEKSFNKSVPKIFNTLKELEPNKAYWIKSEDTFSWTLSINKLQFSSTFDINLREFNIKAKSIGSNNNSIISINRKELDLNEYVIPLIDNNIDIQKDKIILPNLENNDTINFIFKCYKLEGTITFNQNFTVNIPKIKLTDFTNSNYFSNNKEKLLLINFMGCDNNLEKYAYNTMIEQSNMVKKNKENYDICMISFVDRTSYNNISDDTRNWNDPNYFTDTIKDKTLGIYLCNNKSNGKWQSFNIGKFQQTLDIINNSYDNISTKKEVLALFLQLVLENILPNEKNNPLVSISLNMWNHGNFYGISIDHDTVDTMIYMNDIYDVISKNLIEFNLNKFDHLLFECCLTTSIYNILLFSDLAVYFIGASTTQPGDGYHYNFKINGNIKNEFLIELYDKSISYYVSLYSFYYDTISVYDMRRFKYFESNFKKLLESSKGIIDIKSKFSKLKYTDPNVTEMKSVFRFLEIMSNSNNTSKLLNDYYNLLLRSSNVNNAIGILQKNYSLEGEKLDRANNVQYIYNFVKQQPDKPIININFNIIENNIFINLKVVNEMDNDLLLRLSNGFSFVNNFTIVDSTSKSDIYSTKYRKYLRIYKTDNKDINLTLESTSLVEAIYFDGKKYFREDSDYQKVLEIEGEDYNIDSLSTSMELTKLNVNNITGNEDNFIGNINITNVDGNINISGHSMIDENITIAFGTFFNDYLNIKYDTINEKQINGSFNLDLNFNILRIGKEDYFISNYFENEDILKVTTPVIYQNIFNENPTFYSKLVNLELIRDKKTNIVTKKLWDSYNINNTISEIFPEKDSYIYNLFIKPIDYKKQRRIELFSTVKLNNQEYKFGFSKTQENKFIFNRFDEINSFDLLDDKDFSTITVYFISGNNMISKNINRIENTTINVNNTNIIEELQNQKYNDIIYNPNVLYSNEFYSNDWNLLDDKTKNNLITIGFNENIWNERKNNQNFDVETINSEFKFTWGFLNKEIQQALINLGYNSYIWPIRQSNIKKVFIVTSDILLKNIDFQLNNCALVIPSDNYLVIGENCYCENNGAIINYGTLVIQDSGRLKNNFTVINLKAGRVVITSGNKDKKAYFDNSRIFNNLGSVYITGYGILHNKYLLRSDSYIKIGSLNNVKRNKSYAKLINQLLIYPFEQILTNYASMMYGQNIIEIENGAELNNGSFAVIAVNRIFASNDNGYISKMQDLSAKVKSIYTPLGWNTKIVVNDSSEQLLGYENNNIYFGSEITLKEVGVYKEKVNFVSKISKEDSILKFSIKNDSNIDSKGENNKDYFILTFKDINKKVQISFNPLTIGRILSDLNLPLNSFVNFENSNYLMNVEDQFCSIEPPLKANDEFIFYVDMKKFIELTGFGSIIETTLLFDFDDYVKETKQDDNLVSYVFNVNQ